MSPRFVRHLLYGSNDTRVRATWRTCLPVVLAVIVLVVSLLGVRLFATSVELQYSAGIDQFVVGVVMLLALGTVLAVSSRLDHRPLGAYGIGRSPRWVTDLGAGLAVGVVMSGGPIAVGIALGYGTVTEVFAGTSDGAAPLVILLLVFGQIANVLYEEVLYRSILIKNITEGLTARLNARHVALTGALGVSSIVFGFSHILFAGGGGSQGRSLQLVVSAALFGLAWAIAYVLSGHIALPVGIHLAYNLSNGLLFQVSTELAAGTAFPALIRISETSSGFWSSTLFTVLRFSVAILLTAIWVYYRNGTLRAAETLGERNVSRPTGSDQ